MVPDITLTLNCSSAYKGGEARLQIASALSFGSPVSVSRTQMQDALLQGDPALQYSLTPVLYRNQGGWDLSQH